MDQTKPPDARKLERYGLLRRFNGRWQYKTRLTDQTWYSTGTRASAVEMATTAYERTPPAERKTTRQRHRAAEKAATAALLRRFSDRSDGEIQNLIRAAERDLARLHAQLRRLGDNRAYGSTRAAMANGCVGAIGEELLKMKVVLKLRASRKKGKRP